MYKLEKWNSKDPATGTQNYMGPDYSDYYIVYTKTRDSDLMVQHNFDCIREMLPDAEILEFNHWACGWYEQIAVHESDTKSIEVAKKIMDDLNDYPLLNELEYSDKVFDAMNEYWDSMSIRERIDVLKDNDCNILQARKKYIPECIGEYIRAIVEE